MINTTNSNDERALPIQMYIAGWTESETEPIHLIHLKIGTKCHQASETTVTITM